MTKNEPRYPDIEVYLRGVDTAAIQAWVESLSDTPVSWQQKGRTTRGTATLKGQSVPVHLIERATGCWHCIWFESDRTPWPTDLDCGRDVFRALGGVVRCSSGSWSEQPEDEGWMELTAQGERPVKWDNPDK